jgi:hypothetical protein
MERETLQLIPQKILRSSGNCYERNAKNLKHPEEMIHFWAHLTYRNGTRKTEKPQTVSRIDSEIKKRKERPGPEGVMAELQTFKGELVLVLPKGFRKVRKELLQTP